MEGLGPPEIRLGGLYRFVPVAVGAWRYVRIADSGAPGGTPKQMATSHQTDSLRLQETALSVRGSRIFHKVDLFNGEDVLSERIGWRADRVDAGFAVIPPFFQKPATTPPALDQMILKACEESAYPVCREAADRQVENVDSFHGGLDGICSRPGRTLMEWIRKQLDLSWVGWRG